MAELAARIQEPSFIARRELNVLQEIRLIKRIKLGSGALRDRERYGLNEDFDFLKELRELVLKPAPAETDRLVKRINALGKVKLAVVAGIFVSQPDDTTYETPADLFIVGDDVDKPRLAKFLKSLEAEAGTEIRFAVMEKEEFQHRYKYFDRFLRVLLEGPHRKIINKISLESA